MNANTILDAIRNNGGISVNPTNGNQPTTGFVVSVVGCETVISGSEITPEDITEYIETHRGRFGLGSPRCYLGGWIDTETGNVYLDVSEVVNDRETAIGLGRSRGQLAVYDIDTETEVRIPEPAVHPGVLGGSEDWEPYPETEETEAAAEAAIGAGFGFGWHRDLDSWPCALG